MGGRYPARGSRRHSRPEAVDRGTGWKRRPPWGIQASIDAFRRERFTRTRRTEPAMRGLPESAHVEPIDP
jgi:hypothetical protein